MSVISILASGVRISIPLIFAAFGILLVAKSGIVFLGMDGAMTTACFFGVYAAYVTENVWVALLASMLFSILYCLVFGIFVINGHGNQSVCGIGMNYLVNGLTSVLSVVLLNTQNVSPQVVRLPMVTLPVIGKVTVNFFILILMLALVWFLLKATNLGLRIRAVGENPAAADAVGIHVNKYKYIALIFSGILASLAGSELTLGQLGYYARGITESKGLIAFSIVVLGAYHPVLIVLSGLLIGCIDAFQMRAQAFFDLPGQVFIMLPYVMTIAALLLGKRVKGPAALGKPYIRS